ncbi:hypothetical protein TNCV_4964921 [Trichonephila clavipes]|nr:hypothetical protein TNCV_4964921 [Trichonephila clavipes]
MDFKAAYANFKQRFLCSYADKVWRHDIHKLKKQNYTEVSALGTELPLTVQYPCKFQMPPLLETHVSSQEPVLGCLLFNIVMERPRDSY